MSFFTPRFFPLYQGDCPCSGVFTPQLGVLSHSSTLAQVTGSLIMWMVHGWLLLQRDQGGGGQSSWWGHVTNWAGTPHSALCARHVWRRAQALTAHLFEMFRPFLLKWGCVWSERKCFGPRMHGQGNTRITVTQWVERSADYKRSEGGSERLHKCGPLLAGTVRWVSSLIYLSCNTGAKHQESVTWSALY